jgi:hypothetical protein
MAASPVRQALYSRLASDGTLTGLLATASSIFHRRAPRDAPTPFLVIDKEAGTPRYTHGAIDINDELWLVKAVDRSSSASVAETIAARVDTVLRDAPITITGRNPMWLRRDNDVDYLEEDQADAYQHVGAIWRLILST